MDFFDQLLNSYDKLKKRKLRLVESGDRAQAELLANQAVAKVKPENLNNNFITLSKADGLVRAEAVYLYAKSGNIHDIKYGTSLQTGGGVTTVNHGQPAKTNGVLNPTFVGFFSEDQSQEPQSTGQKDPKTAPGTTFQNSDTYLNAGGEDLNPVLDVFQHLATNSENIWKNLSKKSKRMGWEKSKPKFEMFLFGGYNASLERLLMNVKFRVIKDTKGELVTQDVSPEPRTIKEVALNIKFLFDCLVKNTLSPDDEKKLKKFIRPHSNGQVAIYTDLEDSGLVFHDGKKPDEGFLTAIIDSIEDKFKGGKPLFDVVDVKKKCNTGIDNVARGLAFEKILEITSLRHLKMKLISKKLKILRKKKGFDAFDEHIKSASEELNEKLRKVGKNLESWIIKHQQSAISPDTSQLIDELSELLGEGEDGKNLIYSMFQHSKEALSTRNADFIIATGTDTGNGKRDDVSEVYFDLPSCQEALTRQGFSPEDIKAMIKPVTIKVAARSNDGLLKSLTSIGIDSNQPVFLVKTSLKNYMYLDEAVAGTASVGAFDDHLAGFLDGLAVNDPLCQVVSQTIGLDPESVTQVQEYQSKLMNVGDTIRKLSNNMKTMINGKVVNERALDNFVHTCYDKLVREFTDVDLSSKDKKSAKQDLFTLTKKYLESHKDEDKVELGEKIKQYTATLLKNQQVVKDVKNGNKAARNHMMMKFMYAGAADDDGTMCDFRGLISKKNYIFRQNEVMRAAIGSFAKNDGQWNLEAAGNKFQLVHRDGKMKITLNDAIRKRDSGEISTTSIVQFNEHLMKHYDRRKGLGKINSSTELINAFISAQQILLDNLLLIKEETVIKG